MWTAQRHLCPLDPGKSKQEPQKQIEQVTIESIYEDIVKRFEDLVGRETSIQMAIAGIRKQITELQQQRMETH